MAAPTLLTSALLMGKTATAVVVITTILPCVDAEDPSDHPAMPEAQSAQTDCPKIPGQGAPKMTDTGQDNPLANITNAPQAIAFPAVLPTVPPPTGQKIPLNAASDSASLSDMTRIASK